MKFFKKKKDQFEVNRKTTTFSNKKKIQNLFNIKTTF